MLGRMGLFGVSFFSQESFLFHPITIAFNGNNVCMMKEAIEDGAGNGAVIIKG